MNEATPRGMVGAPPSQATYRMRGVLTRVTVSNTRHPQISALACNGAATLAVREYPAASQVKIGNRWDCGIASPSAYAGWGPQARMMLADRTGKPLGHIASMAPECDGMAPAVTAQGCSTAPSSRGWSVMPFALESTYGHLG